MWQEGADLQTSPTFGTWPVGDIQLTLALTPVVATNGFQLYRTPVAAQ